MNAYYERIIQLFSLPIYAFFIPLEIILAHFAHRHYYTLKETAVNIYLNLLAAGIDLLLRGGALIILYYFYGLHPKLINLPPAAYWVILLIGEDFLFWLEHFVDHHCRLFWAVHVTHHSSVEYNLTTGFRSSVFMPFYRCLYFIPLAVAGFKPADILLMYALTQLYGILVHTQYVKKLPRWIEYIFVTPSHHRVHHASNIPYLDKNMGMVFIVWDRLFGTFVAEQPYEPPVYGLVKNLPNPHHPVKIVTHEWVDLRKDLAKKIPFYLKLKYLFMPPGWSHDGSTLTAKQLQTQYNQQNNNRYKS